jgi:hypothetical protein
MPLKANDDQFVHRIAPMTFPLPLEVLLVSHATLLIPRSNLTDARRRLHNPVFLSVPEHVDSHECIDFYSLLCRINNVQSAQRYMK